MDGGGASAGSGASLGLFLNAAPVEVGQLFASRERARLATETELANKGRVIKNGSFYAVLLLVWLRCVPYFSQTGSCPGVLRWVGMRCIDGLGRVVFGRVVFAPEAGRAYIHGGKWEGGCALHRMC